MCLPAIALGGLMPAIAVVVMLRRSGKFRTIHAYLCGVLGAAALGAAALRLYHMEDAAIMVLVWQLGSVAVFSFVGGGISRIVVGIQTVGCFVLASNLSPRFLELGSAGPLQDRKTLARCKTDTSVKRPSITVAYYVSGASVVRRLGVLVAKATRR